MSARVDTRCYLVKVLVIVATTRSRQTVDGLLPADIENIKYNGFFRKAPRKIESNERGLENSHLRRFNLIFLLARYYCETQKTMNT